MAQETLAEKQARARKLTASQRAQILKGFKLTSAQQQTLRTMTADAAERQLQRWQEEYIVKNLPPASGASSSTNKPSQGTTPITTTSEVPPDWEKAAMELYGGYYAIVQSVPELKDLVLQAVREGWDQAKFDYAVRQTNWYKTTTDSARKWDMASQIDPATAEQSILERISLLQTTALDNFGVQFSEQDLRKLAVDSLRGGWGEQTISNAIGLLATKTEEGMSQLASGYVGQTVRRTANEYGLKLSENALNQWVSGIATGQTTQRSFQDYAINTAKSLFPAIAGQLDNGMTFQQIVDPFKTAASTILELNPETIDFTDPRWARAISNPDSNGAQRIMTYSEWGDYLRKDPSFGYEYTSSAQERAFSVANRLANLFGQI